MKKLPKRILVIPPYGRKCLILVGTRDLQNRVRRYKMGRELISMFKKDDLPTKQDDAMFYMDSRGRYIVWLPNRNVSGDSIRHEATHLVEEMQKYVGEKGGHEYRAYFPKWFEKEVRRVLR